MTNHLTSYESALLTAEQRQTIKFFAIDLKDAKLSIWMEPGLELYLQEQRGPDWDNEITIWRCHASGNLEIL